MWEFPNVEGILKKSDVLKLFPTVKRLEKGITNTHIFTHKKWFMKSYVLEVSCLLNDYVWASLDEIKENYAIPTAFMPFLDYMEVIK